MSVFSGHHCATNLFSLGGKVAYIYTIILEDYWMKPALEHNAGPVFPKLFGVQATVKSTSSITPRPAALWKIVDIVIRGALHT